MADVVKVCSPSTVMTAKGSGRRNTVRGALELNEQLRARMGERTNHLAC